MSAQIHPAAIVDAAAQIGRDVQIGPGAVVEADAIVGDGCRLMAMSVIRRWTTLGAGNVVHSFAVLGGEPQDYGHDPAVRSFVVIGNRNVFREGTTISRGTGADAVTTIGDDNYFMTGAHVGHNCVVGNHCIMVNGSALGGYARLADYVNLSAHVVIHQHCWVGTRVMSMGNAASNKHIPPYCMLGKPNLIIGLNRVGIARAKELSDQDRGEIAEAYKILYRSGLPATKALEKMDAHSEWGPAASGMRDFVRRVLEAQPPYNRGILTADAGRR
jgi:UDP-N-acetylglucosamine acyltransferase